MAKLPLAQLPELINKLDQYNEEGERRSEITRAALTFALLTWVRTKELRFAKKHEFEDLDGNSPLWRIGPDRMKMHREHIVPLSMQAASLAKAEAIVTDGLQSYPAAMRELGNLERREVGRWLNNRAENSHLPFRRRERAMLRFRQMKSLQKFASVHANVHNHFNSDRHLIDRQTYKEERPYKLADGEGLLALD